MHFNYALMVNLSLSLVLAQKVRIFMHNENDSFVGKKNDSFQCR